MRRVIGKTIFGGIGVFVAVCVVSAAAAQPGCVPLPPKTWELSIEVGTGGWVGIEMFRHDRVPGECAKWTADVKGIDFDVADAEGYAGVAAALTATTASPLAIFQIAHGGFLDDQCRWLDYFKYSKVDFEKTVQIPEGTRWIVAWGDYGTYDVEVNIEAFGRECDEPTPSPTPKKKKRRG